ncbi:MAG: glycosyltransferase family 2 protein [Candidatus Woesearchaeota archaeon]|nr:glycosyltransferase family 2 protein [Candidatus Woesearchaeota archaeon]
MKLSMVIPVYNEEKSIFPLYNRLSAVLSKYKNYEIIFVDDGSRDRTFANIQILHKKDKHVKAIKFKRNFGQTAALSAGFEHANGDIIVTMDGDLQNDPEDIPRLIEKINEGHDMVSGWRHKRKDSFAKKLSSSLANIARRIMLKDKIHDSGCALKAYKKESIKDLEIYGEMHRYLPAIVAMNGYKVGEIRVNHHPRKFGKTKYSTTRIFKGLLDLFYIKFWSDYSTRPLHFFGFLGLSEIFIGLLLVIYNFIKYSTHLLIGPTLLLAVLLVITGVQFIVFGFLAEILIRTYYGANNDKGYKIEKTLK